MSAYYSDMTSLPDEHPEVHEFTRDGGLSVQLSNDNTLGRIPVDQTLKETVNKDTQTPGGTKGFSLKPGAVQRYYLTAEFRTLFLRSLRQMVGYAAIWRNSLRNNDVPSPVGHGWSLVNDGAQERLVIDWMSGLPAPTAVIELISCMCKKGCTDDSYDCIRNGLKCSDLCRLTTCSNRPDEEEDIHVDLDEEDVEFD